MGNEGLKLEWRIFAEAIAIGESATEAYFQAGYQTTDRASAQRAASRLKKRPEVAAYIDELRRAAAGEGRDSTIITMREKLEILARIIRATPSNIHETDDICQSFRTNKDGTTATRLPDKLRAIKLHTDLAGETPPRKTAAKPDPADTPMARYIHALRALPAGADPSLID